MRFLGFILCIVPSLVWCQIGGQFGFQSLNITTNARAAALGGTVISLNDGDLSQFFENPAILDSVEKQNFFVNFNPYFGDSFVFTGAYSFEINGMGTFSSGLNYVSFGAFEMRDESGNELGTFQAQDYTFFLGKAHRVGPFTLGANLKMSHSSIDIYGASAVLMDVGGVFNLNKNWAFALVFENMGFRVSDFTDLQTPKLPFDVKLGTTFKPRYMPLRFTLTSNNLVSENVSNTEERTGRSNEAVDKVLKRVNFGAEVLLNSNFQMLFGYNHKRKQELRLTDLGGGAGFSYGLMLKIKRIEFRFSRATYHAAGGTSFISLRTDLNDFKTIL